MSDPLERVDIKSLQQLVRLRERREEAAARDLAKTRAIQEHAYQAWQTTVQACENAKEARRQGEQQAYSDLTGQILSPGDLDKPKRVVGKLQKELDGARDREREAHNILIEAKTRVEEARKVLRTARDELKRWQDMEENASIAQQRLASRREEEVADDELLDRIGSKTSIQ